MIKYLVSYILLILGLLWFALRVSKLTSPKKINKRGAKRSSNLLEIIHTYIYGFWDISSPL